MLSVTIVTKPAGTKSSKKKSGEIIWPILCRAMLPKGRHGAPTYLR